MEADNGEQKLFGRGENDHERLFPKYTSAQAASQDEVTVNGKTLKIWTFSQLETLKPAILRQRVGTIRDAVGEANCPPVPTMQVDDMIRWVLHMQAMFLGKDLGQAQCRNAMQGYGPSQAFLKESEDRPIVKERSPSPTPKGVPFGIRKMQPGMETLRDHYNELLERKGEFKEPRQTGIATLRVGGEGRRHIQPKDNMENDGVSKASPLGIQSMREQGEGRKYLVAKDHLFDQQKEREAMERGVPMDAPKPRQGPESIRQGGYNMKALLGTYAPGSDPEPPAVDERQLGGRPSDEVQLGGERKRHMMPEDHMLNNGTADAVEATIGHGRKHIDNFAGRTQMGGTQDNYRATWKQDPSRLMGTSLIV